MPPPTLEELRERVRPWAEPIEGAAPAGVQAKHEPAYEAVTAEVAKLESPASDPVRWDDVVMGAGGLLQHTTKDLWLAAYLGYGLYATQGLSGAATGVALLTELTERYWPDLFPELKRLRGRANAVTWFVDRLGRMLPGMEQSSVDAEGLEALSTAVRRLAEVSRQRFADQGPAFGPLTEGMARLRAGLPPPAPAAPTPAATPPPATEATPPAAQAAPPAAQAAPPASAAPTPTPKPSPAASAPPPPPVSLPPLPAMDLASTEAATDFLRNVGTALLGAAGALRRASAADPLPYRLSRMGLWLHLTKPPAAGANGRTPLPAPPAALRTKLEALAGNSRWADLLDEAESALLQHRFALTFHRYSADALAGLGESHAAARASLVLELGIMLRRLPGAEELLASDGTPLTDEPTRAWLRSEVLRAAAPPPATSGTSTGAPGSTASVALALPPPSLAASSSGNAAALQDEAHALLNKGEVGEAVARLQAAVASTTSGRERFLARLTLARLCANAGLLPLARSLYEALDAEVTAHALDMWEPALAAACLEGWLSTLTATENENEGVRLSVKFRNRYRRLTQLDPSAALRVRW